QFKKAAADRRPPKQTGPGPQIPGLEKILLQTLLASNQVRQEILPRLKAQDLTAREIFEAILHQQNSGSPVTFPSIEARLSEPSKALLHDIAAADEISDDELAMAQAQACLRRLESDSKRKHIDELRAKVKALEREGRIKEALDIMAELERLRKEMGGESTT